MDLFLFKYYYLFKKFTLGMDKLVQLGWEYGYLKSHMFTNKTLACTFQPITNMCAVCIVLPKHALDTRTYQLQTQTHVLSTDTIHYGQTKTYISY